MLFFITLKALSNKLIKNFVSYTLYAEPLFIKYLALIVMKHFLFGQVHMWKST